MLAEDKESTVGWEMAVMMIQVVSIISRQLRGLHAGKVTEMADSIASVGFHLSSVLTVHQMANGEYILVDGMHRLSAVMFLISVGKLTRAFMVRCVVLKPETPASWILRYSYLVNLGNDATAKVTFIDKCRWSSTYINSLLPEWKTNSNKAKATDAYYWYDIPATYIRDMIMGNRKVSPVGFTLGPVQRLMGFMRAIRTDTNDDFDASPLIYQSSSAWTEMLVLGGNRCLVRQLLCLVHVRRDGTTQKGTRRHS